jgi:hypothetical protein
MYLKSSIKHIMLDFTSIQVAASGGSLASVAAQQSTDLTLTEVQSLSGQNTLQFGATALGDG